MTVETIESRTDDDRRKVIEARGPLTIQEVAEKTGMPIAAVQLLVRREPKRLVGLELR